jgi:hypothetical protein
MGFVPKARELDPEAESLESLVEHSSLILDVLLASPGDDYPFASRPVSSE